METCWTNASHFPPTPEMSKLPALTSASINVLCQSVPTNFGIGPAIDAGLAETLEMSLLKLAATRFTARSSDESVIT